jgi:hydroxymethylglutaryl-CoA lyase
MALNRESFPKSVTIYEVGPRDGLQNESIILKTSDKIELVNLLLKAGLPAVEIGSFVRPDLIPALADSNEVAVGLKPLLKSNRLVALVPNMKGLDRALEAGVREVAVIASATESFARANLNNSVQGSLEIFRPVIEQALLAGLNVRGYISMCYGDPWEGKVAPDKVTQVAEKLFEYGISELSLGDTIGVATPGDVISLLDSLESVGISRNKLAVHFHDTYGQALSNTLVSLQEGISIVDASIGGLGGCPFAKSATGNLSTEDLVWQLHGLGIQTGVNFEGLIEISKWLSQVVGLKIKSKTAIALGADKVNS